MNEDKELIIFLQEQNKDLKEALNSQLDKLFTLQDEKSKIEDELDFLKCEKESESDHVDKSAQTNEFDDPFEQELFEESRDNSFRYTLTELGENEPRGSNITYLTAHNEGSAYNQEQYLKMRGEQGQDELGFGGQGFKKKQQGQEDTRVKGLNEKVASLTNELLAINKENMKFKHELKTAVTSLQKLQIIHENYEDRILSKDKQISELKDQIVKIGNMVNEEKLADYHAITVTLLPKIKLFTFLDTELENEGEIISPRG